MIMIENKLQNIHNFSAFFRVITPPEKLDQATFALEQARIIIMLNIDI